jgi:hypothetical protein
MAVFLVRTAHPMPRCLHTPPSVADPIRRITGLAAAPSGTPQQPPARPAATSGRALLPPEGGGVPHSPRAAWVLCPPQIESPFTRREALSPRRWQPPAQTRHAPKLSQPSALPAPPLPVAAPSAVAAVHPDPHPCGWRTPLPLPAASEEYRPLRTLAALARPRLRPLRRLHGIEIPSCIQAAGANPAAARRAERCVRRGSEVGKRAGCRAAAAYHG